MLFSDTVHYIRRVSRSKDKRQVYSRKPGQVQIQISSSYPET
jgi:hypothetical protein